ncbi:uncharacterized protein B4U79_02758, partial [Dinothrombium tinctorium]
MILIYQKLPYPCGCVTSFDKYYETYLSIDDFYDKLKEKRSKKEKYELALKVWNEFGCKDKGDFSDLYVEFDNYKLDPAWYFTTPGLAWDVILKHTKIKFELLKDNDMILMIENGIRGGISQCSHRYAKANNKYIE